MTKSEQHFFNRGYGQFPYIIIRESSGFYRQIPILKKDSLNSELEGVYLTQSEFKSHQEYKDCCIQVFLKLIQGETVPLSKKLIKPNHWVFAGKSKIKKRGCIVFSKNECHYYEEDELGLSKRPEIPWGGTLINLSDETMEFENNNHFIDNDIDRKTNQLNDQQMLSKMMRETKESGSIQSDEVMKWWMNRY